MLTFTYAIKMGALSDDESSFDVAYVTLHPDSSTTDVKYSHWQSSLFPAVFSPHVFFFSFHHRIETGSDASCTNTLNYYCANFLWQWQFPREYKYDWSLHVLYFTSSALSAAIVFFYFCIPYAHISDVQIFMLIRFIAKITKLNKTGKNDFKIVKFDPFCRLAASRRWRAIRAHPPSLFWRDAIVPEFTAQHSVQNIPIANMV